MAHKAICSTLLMGFMSFLPVGCTGDLAEPAEPRTVVEKPGDSLNERCESNSDCSLGQFCHPRLHRCRWETECSDGRDNDRDRLIDCADSDCSTSLTCNPAQPCQGDSDCLGGWFCDNQQWICRPVDDFCEPPPPPDPCPDAGLPEPDMAPDAAPPPVDAAPPEPDMAPDAAPLPVDAAPPDAAPPALSLRLTASTEDMQAVLDELSSVSGSVLDPGDADSVNLYIMCFGDLLTLSFTEVDEALPAEFLDGIDFVESLVLSVDMPLPAGEWCGVNAVMWRGANWAWFAGLYRNQTQEVHGVVDYDYTTGPIHVDRVATQDNGATGANWAFDNVNDFDGDGVPNGIDPDPLDGANP